MAKELLTAGERGRIGAAITQAESRTRAELVPVLAASSDTYPGARWRLAVAFALSTTTAAWIAVPGLDATYMWAAVLPMLAIGHLLASWPPLLRLALTKRETHAEVRQRAIERFFELGLHTTSDRDGVLIFVSLLEHRIEVLADVEIDRVAPEGFWKEIVDGLAARIRRGELAAGLEEALSRCGELLAEHFPRRPEDDNELADEVVVE